MATVTKTTSTEVLAPVSIPRLQNGDRLTRAEFERRYVADPTLKKAELIDGVVYMPSPVRQDQHGKPHFNAIVWLGHYTAVTPGVEGGDNASIRLDPKNMPQPDAFLLLRREHGGQAVIDEDGYVCGAPELVAEIAASSVSYDLHDKLAVFRRHSVKEYVVWRVEEHAIDWFVLRSGQFISPPLTDGIYRSEVFPGLWLDPQALIAGDLSQVAKVAQAGLESQEHRTFVEKLRTKNK